MVAAGTAAGLTRLTLPAESPIEAIEAAGLESNEWRDDAEFANLFAELERYFDGKQVSFAKVPLDQSKLTPFRRQVYWATRAVAQGKTATYGEIAASLGNPQMARAVGAALGGNQVCIVVPCHRVVGANGSLTGFSGGLPFKQRLLELEGAASFRS